MAGNTIKGRPVNRATEWKRFDALPKAMRELYARSPFEFGLSRADQTRRELYDTGRLTLAEWRRATVTMMCETIMHYAAKDYGRDHPDAMRSRQERRG